MPKLTVIAAYGGVFALIVAVIAVGYQPPQPTASTANAANAAVRSPLVSPVATNDVEKPAVDEILANDIAAHLAERTNMPVSSYVANTSISLAAKSALAQTSDTTIVKPEIVQATLSSRDITTYVAKQGDTVSAIAASYGLQPDTVRWANNLTSDTIAAGKKLTIPPIDGVIYTVKAGDTPEKVASTYKASKERIISFNDLEISGMTAGAKIVIPNGNLPETQRPGYQPSVSGGYVNYGAYKGGSAGNRYAGGNCTWYAYEYRKQAGRPVGSFWGNASTWAIYARMDGLRVDREPEVGAIAQWNAYAGGSYGWGHVGIVKAVYPDGTIRISEMNYLGQLNRVTERTIHASTVSNFIH